MEILLSLKTQMLGGFANGKTFQLVAEEEESNGDFTSVGATSITFNVPTGDELVMSGVATIDIGEGKTVNRLYLKSSTQEEFAYEVISDGYYQYGGRFIINSLKIKLV